MLAPPGALIADLRLAPGLRAWFTLFLLWMGGLTWVACVSLAHYEQTGAEAAFRIWLLALMTFYLTLCNSLLPLPTAWIVLLAASPTLGLPTSALINVLLVSLLAAVATVAANLNEYHLLTCLLERGLGPRLRRTQLYAWAARWFDRTPFQLLTLLAFVPIPVDAVRWLAILRRYPRRRFALAYLLGRWPRYALLAGCSTVLNLTSAQIVWIQLGLVAAALAARLLWYLLRRRPAASQGASTVPEELVLSVASNARAASATAR